MFNIVSSIPLMKTLALETRTGRRFDDLVERMRVFSLERDNAALLAGPLQQMFTLTALLIVVVGAVALARTDRTVELSVMCAFLLLVRRAVPLLGFATTLRLRLSQAQPSLERLAEVFDDNDKAFVTSGPREFQGLRHGIEFRDLSFSYTDDLPVLRRLSCTLAGGKDDGARRGNGLRQDDRGQPDRAPLRMSAGHGVLRRRRHPRVLARLARTRNLLRRAGGVAVQRHAARQPRRRARPAGAGRGTDRDAEPRPARDDGGRVAGRSRHGDRDRGTKLSGGEKQRLCIARALLRRADLVLLDEATSALDSETELDVLQAIEQVTRGATVVTIAHRLSTVQSADKVLVLARGELLEEGSWNQLVSAQGVFAAMWNLQSQMAAQRPDAVHGAR